MPLLGTISETLALWQRRLLGWSVLATMAALAMLGGTEAGAREALQTLLCAVLRGRLHGNTRGVGVIGGYAQVCSK